MARTQTDEMTVATVTKGKVKVKFEVTGVESVDRTALESIARNGYKSRLVAKIKAAIDNREVNLKQWNETKRRYEKLPKKLQQPEYLEFLKAEAMATMGSDPELPEPDVYRYSLATLLEVAEVEVESDEDTENGDE